MADDKHLAKAFKTFLNISGFTSNYVETSYGLLHYYDNQPKSKNIPIVLIHGLGSSGQSWWILAEMLHNKRRLILPDLFHMGGFSQPRKDILDLPQHASTVYELLNHVAPQEKVDLIGLSLGGWISLHLAAYHKDRIDRVVLMNPAGLQIKALELRHTLNYLNWKKFQSIYPDIFIGFPYTGVPFLSKTIKKNLYNSLNQQTIKDFLKTVAVESFLDSKLLEIQAEILLLWGQEDHFLSPKIAEKLVSTIPNIQGKWVAGCAHVLPLESPASCFLEINRFLNLVSLENNIFAKMVLQFTKHHPLQEILVKAPFEE